MNKTHKKKLILLDAHAILHRSFHALPKFTSPTGEPTGALYGFISFLIKIIREMEPDCVAACFDLPEPTFRHEVYKEYKGTRSKTDDLLVSQLKRAYDVLDAFNIPSYYSSGFEADDILGTVVEKLKDKKDLQIIIASGDLDTLQLVKDNDVVVYTLRKGIKDTIIYDEEAVIERFGFVPKLLPDFKGIKGDPSDNIIGVAGIGDKGATGLISNFGTLENIYKVLKKDKSKLEEKGIKARTIGLLEENEEEALFSKNLAEIRRDAPIELSIEECEWKEGFSIDKAEALFDELGFKNMSSRLDFLRGGVVE